LSKILTFRGVYQTSSP